MVGWSWLFPPYAGTSTHARSRTSASIAFDGACLRGKCEADHELGYELMKRFAQLMIDRLEHTRSGCWTSMATPPAARRRRTAR